MKLTVLHLLLILIGIIVACTIGYQFVSNINEPFYVDTEPTCPPGKEFAVSSGTCMDSTNPSFQTASAPICPTGSNLDPATGKCKVGAPALPDQYWLPAEQRKSTPPATTMKPTCPPGKQFTSGINACTSSGGENISPAICPTGSNLNIAQGLCVKGAPAPPDKYWLLPVKPATAATAATPTTGAAAPTCYDPNGNVISLTSLLGLSGAPPSGNAALTTSQTALPTCPAGQVYDFVQQICVPTTSTKPICPAGQILDMTQGLCITNIPAIPSFSSTQNIASSKASDSAILQNVQQIVHNELLSQKGMTTGAQLAFLGQKKEEEEEDEEEEDDASPSNHQGREYTRDCAKNTGTRNSARVPDMSKYIRKDSIPCWGCTLPQ